MQTVLSVLDTCMQMPLHIHGPGYYPRLRHANCRHPSYFSDDCPSHCKWAVQHVSQLLLAQSTA